ncbi:MAG TPA: hypothetical protein VLL52_23805, partial [Anaerolineae bacterium]|nr:hypothetical protein [Anaerolineae bacterium]
MSREEIRWEKGKVIGLTIILLLAGVWRIWLGPMRGHIHDIEQLKSWVMMALGTRPLAIYDVSSANYPPLALWPLMGMGYVYRWWSPEMVDSGLWTTLLKVPAMVADLVLVVIIYRWMGREWGPR